MGDRDPFLEDGDAAPDEAGRNEQPITSAPARFPATADLTRKALAGQLAHSPVSADCALSRALVEVMYGSLTDDAAMKGRGLQAALIDIRRNLKDD
jgi:hypothetical protein